MFKKVNNHKINVVHVTENLNVGGLERLVVSIVLGLDKSKFDVKVWCLVKGGEFFDKLKHEGVDVKIIGLNSSRNSRSLGKLKEKLKHEKIDIVHTHGVTATNLGRIAAKFAKVPVIIAHMHSTYYSYTIKQRIIDKVLSWFSDKVICCSEAVSEFIHRKEWVSKKKLQVIYNGVDTEKFKPLDTNGEGINRIACVASLFEHKGHKYLIDAMSQIINRCSSKIKLEIIGDGVLRKDLEEQVKRLGLENNIEFKGEISNIADILPFFDIAVLTSSLREGLGISLLEAMACGLPVIGTKIGGIPEVIADEKNGILVAPQNSEELAKAILKIMNNKSLARQMGEKSRSIACEKFSQKLMIKKIEKLYENLLNDKK